MNVALANASVRTSDDWPAGSLADLCSLVSDQCDPARTDHQVYIGLEHIDSGAFTISRHGNPKDVVSAKNRFAKNDILYGKLRPYLDKAVLAQREGICSTDILVFRPRENVCPLFVLALIHSKPFTEYAVQTTHGVNHPRTSWAALRDFQCSIPSFSEQEKIAAVLWTIQKAVEIEEAIVRNARDLKKSLVRQLFTHGLRGEPLKETEIGPLPESWQIDTIGSTCDIRTSRMSYAELLTAEGAKVGVILHGVKVSDMNLPGNEGRFTTANLVRRFPSDEAKRRAIPAGAIVFPKRGAAIATNKKRLTTTWTVLDPNLIAIVPGSELDPDFLLNWLFTFDLATITEPGPTPQLNKKNVEPIVFPKPAKHEQREIAAILQNVDRKIEIHESKKRSLQELFKTMLHELMTAQIRVSDLEIDTSEVIK
jgi:type I restriction enzyme, S subunit